MTENLKTTNHACHAICARKMALYITREFGLSNYTIRRKMLRADYHLQVFY